MPLARRWIAAAAAIPLALTTAGASAAADQACSFATTAPSEVVIGAGGTTVTWQVQSDCGDDTALNWYLTMRDQGAEGPWGWNLVANHPQSPGSRYAFYEGGEQYLEFDRNDAAGTDDVFIDAYRDDDGDDQWNGETEPYIDGIATVRWLRETGFRHLDATPEPVVRGKSVAVKARLYIADWEANDYVGYGGKKVLLQFKPSGSNSWRGVKWVRTNGAGWAQATVKQASAGTWRYTFSGTGISAASTSAGDGVAVKSPPKPKPKPKPVPKPKPRPKKPKKIYYKNCTEARRKGAAPIYRGEPGYRIGLDRDRDGVACE